MEMRSMWLDLKKEMTYSDARSQCVTGGCGLIDQDGVETIDEG